MGFLKLPIEPFSSQHPIVVPFWMLDCLPSLWSRKTGDPFSHQLSLRQSTATVAAPSAWGIDCDDTRIDGLNTPLDQFRNVDGLFKRLESPVLESNCMEPFFGSANIDTDNRWIGGNRSHILILLAEYLPIVKRFEGPHRLGPPVAIENDVWPFQCRPSCTTKRPK